MQDASVVASMNPIKSKAATDPKPASTVLTVVDGFVFIESDCTFPYAEPEVAQTNLSVISLIFSDPSGVW